MFMSIENPSYAWSPQESSDSLLRAFSIFPIPDTLKYAQSMQCFLLLMCSIGSANGQEKDLEMPMVAIPRLILSKCGLQGPLLQPRGPDLSNRQK